MKIISSVCALLFLLTCTAAQASIAFENLYTASGGAALSVTTANANDLIIIFAVSGAGGADCSSPWISDASGLTWITRQKDSNANPMATAESYAIASFPVTGDTISMSVGGGCSGVRWEAFVISGANPTTPFDTSISFPAENVASTTPNTIVATTNNANDLLVGFIRGAAALGTVVAPLSFASVATGSTSQDLSYQVVSSVQTSTSFIYTYTTIEQTKFYLDAVQAASASFLPFWAAHRNQ